MKPKADPNALRREIVTLEILTNQPRTALSDVVKYWLYIHDRQVKVTKVTVKETR